MTAENELVELWPLSQFQYCRESERRLPAHDNQFLIKTRHSMAGEGTITLAYTVSHSGETVRYWWIWGQHFDGIDPPTDICPTPFRIVDARTIRAGKASEPWRALKSPCFMHPRLTKRPTRLIDRFEKWEYRHKPRIVPAVSRFQRIRNWLALKLRAIFRWLVKWR